MCEQQRFFDEVQAEREYAIYQILAKVKRAMLAGLMSRQEFTILLAELGADEANIPEGVYAKRN